MTAFKTGDRIRVSRDHRGHFVLNSGTRDLGELRLLPRSGPRLTLGDRQLVVRAFDNEWRLLDEDTEQTLATLVKRELTIGDERFAIERRPFGKHARLTDAEGRTLLRFERITDGRSRSLVAHVVELPEADALVLFAFAAVAVVLKGTFKPPKERAAEGHRVGAWARGGQWGYSAAFYGGFAGIGNLSEGGGGSFGGDSGGGGGFGDFGGGDFGGGGGGDGGGGGGSE